MSTSGAPAPAVTPMPGSALLPAELARPSRHHGRLRGRLIPSALAIRPWAALRRSRFAWLLSTATLGALAALVAGIAVIGESGSPGSEQQQSQREASASSLEPLRPGVLAASANPFGATALVHRSVTRVRRPHPSNSRRPRSHRARHADLSSTADHRQSSCGGSQVHAGPTHVGERRSDPRHPKQLRNGVDATCHHAVAPTHYTSSSNSGSGSSSGSASPSQSDAPLAGHRSRPVRLLTSPAEASNTDRR